MMLYILGFVLTINLGTAMTTTMAMAMVNPDATSTRHIHFNNAGDSPSPPQVTNAIVQHMNLETQVGGYRAAALADVGVAKVYDSAARLIGAGIDENKNDSGEVSNLGRYNAKDEIALVESATVGWTRFFYAALETKERELSLSLSLGSRKIRNEKDIEKEELIILVSEAEYAANLVAAVKFARDHTTPHSRFRWRVFPIPSCTTIDCGGGLPVSSGTIDLNAFQTMLKGTFPIGGHDDKKYLDPASIAMVCVTQIPTNAGIINPVNEIGIMIDEFNSIKRGDKPTSDNNNDNDSKLPQIIYLVDACQSVGQISVNAKDMRCHTLAATGRKYLRGPRGTGFLYIQQQIANMLEPSHVDHAAAPVVKVMEQSASWTHGLEEESEFGLRHTYLPGAARFEFWESNVATRLGLGAAIDVALSVGMDTIEGKCALLGGVLRQRLRAMDGVHVYHDKSCACGIVTFSVDNLDAAAVKERMQNGLSEDDSDSIAHPLCCYHLSVVPATSTPLDSSHTGLGERSLIRASLSYFNTEDEINSFCKALERIKMKRP